MNHTGFKTGEISGVVFANITKYVDERGWLAELYRTDELEEQVFPKMAYVSQTKPGIQRGPHEHASQTDYFCFLGPSNFKIILWDNRKDSRTYLNKMVFFFGQDRPSSLLVPPGVVHAYKNIGVSNGIMINAANFLYAGYKKKEHVDEIRYEDDPQTPFIFD